MSVALHLQKPLGELRLCSVICCIFTKSNSDFTAIFDITPHLQLISDSTLHQSYILYCYSSCVYPFTYLFIVNCIFLSLLGDRLCWVYDPPVHLYGELSTFRLHLFYIVHSYRSSFPTHAHCSRTLPSPPS